ncbi:MAG: EscU/YscU/HrcU family type III secretion system export apparatus switch protein [Ilumatobacteraceae bacterium]|nr:EscU/YscU/HrcU family type III secretion system export apparatus switch protein [Acidimicrobiales bacterium]MCB9392759.1 EscU/YscU/HrcU family type III secretion system export apparatus switch protein [Acidimicrobiaceae bacterium]
MSKRDGKTEAPTEKRKRDARKKGTISKSQDLGPWIAVLVGTYALPATVGGTSEAATSAFASLRDLGAQPDTERAVDVLGRALFAGLTAVLPFLTVMIVVGVASHVAQAGLLVSMHPLRPDLKRLNPITGFKNLFSAKQLWNTGKQVAKSAVIGWLCWPKVQDIADELTGSGRVGLMDGLSASGHALLGMTRTTCWAIIVISLADFAFQRRSKLLDLRMTKQEIRDEMKNSEGDPHIKGRIRQMQMTLARSRMMNDVPTASVVVTNPTHVAVALRYDPVAGGAPKVVAAGVDKVAARIREKAIAAGVPIVEAKPLARALWRSCEVGDEIPAPLYEAVAKVLAFVRRLRGGLLSATSLPLPRQYHVDEQSLEAVQGRRRKRLPAA